MTQLEDLSVDLGPGEVKRSHTGRRPEREPREASTRWADHHKMSEPTYDHLSLSSLEVK